MSIGLFYLENSTDPTLHSNGSLDSSGRVVSCQSSAREVLSRQPLAENREQRNFKKKPKHSAAQIDSGQENTLTT